MQQHEKSTAQKIRVTYVINTLKIGGAQMVVFNLASKLDLTRFSVCVYYFFKNETPDGTFESLFHEHGIQTQWLSEGNRTNFFSKAMLLRHALKEQKVTIVHAHLPYAIFTSALACFLNRSTSLIIHDHQTRSYYGIKVRLLFRLAERVARLCLSYSEAVQYDAFKSVFVLKEPPATLPKSCTIYNGVDTSALEKKQTSAVRTKMREELQCREKDVLILSVARFIPWKGQRELLEAFITLSKKISDSRLCLVGSGSPIKEELEERVRKTNLSSRVMFLGDRKDVPELLCAADIVSLVYVYGESHTGDAVGISGIEALATGLPLIAGAGLPIIAGLYDKQNIVLVQPENSESLCQALTALSTDPATRKRIGISGKRFVQQNLSWSRIVPIYERIYFLLTNA